LTFAAPSFPFSQTYGYHHLPLLLSLSRLSLFNKPPTPSPTIFPSLRKPLRLIVDDVDESAPNDISYVYSGYAPVSVRLVQCVAQKAALVSTPTPVVIAGEGAGGAAGTGGGVLMPRAHPIVGWKGFEDVLSSECWKREGEEEKTRRAFVRADLALFLAFQPFPELLSMIFKL